MSFEFATAGRVIFGSGAASRIAGLAANAGVRPCVVTGRDQERCRWLFDQLQAHGSSPLAIRIAGEPDTDAIMEAAKTARMGRCDLVIALGGGSVVDAGKALAALVANQRDLFDYLEVIGKGRPFTQLPVPFIAAPTTAGTGSEVTANAMLLSAEHGLKVSLGSPDMFPGLAVVDPQLTLSLPKSLTAATGMNALAQLIEAFVSLGANPMTDALCRQGIVCASRSLKKVYENGNNLQAREDMALAGMLSGMAQANTKLGAVHGLADSLGGRLNAPHGAVSAALTPWVMEMNLGVLRESGGQGERLAAFADTARLLTGHKQASAEEGIVWLKQLVRDLRIPGLAVYGAAEDDLEAIAEQASRSNSMKGNPVALKTGQLIEVLQKAL